MTICERRALQIKWEAGEPGVRYRMPVALARERVARAERRKGMWWLDHPSGFARFLSDVVTESVRAIEGGLARIADVLNEMAAWMHGEATTCGEAMRRGWRRCGGVWKLDVDCGSCLVCEMPYGNWSYEYVVADRSTRAFGAAGSFEEAVRRCENGIGFGGGHDAG